MTSESTTLLDIVSLLAPGTPLRNAVQRIIQNRGGALVVLGTGPEVETICTGGFILHEASFNTAKLAELAKMDGAIVLDDSYEWILRANTHLLPDSDVPTSETGARFRTAERVARQTGKPVVAVSEERHIATIFLNDEKLELESPHELVGKVNQELQTLERFRARLDDAEDRLTRFEVSDQVTLRAAVSVLQRAELVRRIGDQIARDAIGLGRDGSLVELQHADLVQGTAGLREFVLRDYVRGGKRKVTAAMKALEGTATEDLYDADQLASLLNMDHPDTPARPQGYRLLSQVPRLPVNVQEALVRHFKDFQKMIIATVEELDDVNGVGGTRALELRRFFDRLMEMAVMADFADL